MKKEDKKLSKKLMKDKKKVNQTSVIQDVMIEEQESPSDTWKTIELLMNNQYKRRKTILDNNQQVKVITTLDVISQLYDITFLKLWIRRFGEWRTSGEGGQGRKDIVDIYKFSELTRQNERADVMDLLRSGGSKK